MQAEAVLDQVGSRLAVLSKSAGLTQDEIAKRCQISRITINRFFKGRTEIRSGDLVQLLSLFGIDVLALLDDKIERKMSGKSMTESTESKQIAKALEELDPQVSRTILDQISWWKNAQQPAADKGIDL